MKSRDVIDEVMADRTIMLQHVATTMFGEGLLEEELEKLFKTGRQRPPFSGWTGRPFPVFFGKVVKQWPAGSLSVLFCDAEPRAVYHLDRVEGGPFYFGTYHPNHLFETRVYWWHVTFNASRDRVRDVLRKATKR
jgi:hypothetical protein